MVHVSYKKSSYIHTVVALASGVIGPSPCCFTTTQFHCWQLLEIAAELLDVTADGGKKHQFALPKIEL